jgi:5-methyltetrahydrofolate--homocysteine methyltransferase
VDWSAPENAPVRPNLLGTKVYHELDLEQLLPYIDWNPFFQVRRWRRRLQRWAGRGALGQAGLRGCL